MFRYIGRFAPTPSGPMHFGSLVAAGASYLDAKFNGGLWLVRVDDLDTPRVVPGAAEQILNQLMDYGFTWDQKVVYQAERTDRYQAALDQLYSKGLVYACSCSRKQIQTRCQSTIYDGYCRSKSLASGMNQAERFLVPDQRLVFQDMFQGQQTFDTRSQLGDFILKRSDGFFAYHLACALDDLEQGVTHVIRGFDLIQSTFAQRLLSNALANKTLKYGHHPLVVNDQNIKFSKSAASPAITKQKVKENLVLMLEFLNQSPPKYLNEAEVDDILQWGIAHWDRKKVGQQEAVRL